MYRVLLQINRTKRYRTVRQHRLFFATLAEVIEDFSKIFHRRPEWHVYNHAASIWISVDEVGERLSEVEQVVGAIRARLQLDEKGVQLHITQEKPISPEEANEELRRILEVEDD